MASNAQQAGLLEALIRQGVQIPAPATVFVDADIVPARIAAGVILHPGSRLVGKTTSMGPGCVMGEEAPVTVEDCQLGHDVRLKGGYISGATLLDRSALGSASHVRPGTLMEEESSGAHAVGFKQTILLPFVTVGSLVNLCDILMAGGTSRQDHSEVGSSYIHFNFTPRQDKAAASLIGDVPRGVMLDQPPIFLGGQGGLVGPARIEFGTVIAAGVVLRTDALEPGKLHAGGQGGRSVKATSFDPRIYGRLDRLVVNNLHFLGNVVALRGWYRHARAGFFQTDPFRAACLDGAGKQLQRIFEERLARLGQVAERLPQSVKLLEAMGGKEEIAREQRRVIAGWPRIRESLLRAFQEDHASTERDVFLGAFEKAGGGGTFLGAVKALPPQARQQGTRWLQAVVDRVVSIWHAEA